MPQDNQIPAKYLCSITGQIMIDPVMAADGHTYEREAIEKWLEEHDTSPKTNETLEDKKLRTNHDKRGSLLKFLDKHSELYDGNEVYLPKFWVAQLAMAIKSNEHQAVQRWLDKDRRLLTSKLEGDFTALYLACEFSSPELVSTLLETLKRRNKLVIPCNPAYKSVHLNTLLERALNSGDYAKCELLLKLGAEVEQPEASTQNTLLHRMVIQDNPPAASWLLDQKAILESRNSDDNTPLLLSVIHNNTKFTEFLLKKNANPKVKNAEQQSPALIAQLNQNKPILCLLVGAEKAALSPLHLALELNDNEIIKVLLRQSSDAIDTLDEQGRTPFYSAVERRNLETARLLLAQGANYSIRWGTAQLNALHVASGRGDTEMLKYLLQTQAVTLIDAQNANGDTSLHLAVQAGHDSIIPILLGAGAYHKIKNEQDQTPIELARAQQKFKIANLIAQTVRELKQAKLKKIERLHQKEIEILHQVVAKQAGEISALKAALHCEQSRIKLLHILIENTVDFRKRDENGKTVVYIAVENGLADIALFKAAGINVEISDNAGKRPIDIAAGMGNTVAITALKAAGADLNRKDNYGRTPVYIAAENGRVAAITELCLASNVNEPNNQGKTPVYAAAEIGHAVAIATLKAAGANMDKPANYYSVNYPYDSSRPQSNRTVVASSLSDSRFTYSNQLSEAESISEGNLGTPVFIASQKGHAAAVSALIVAGANVNTPDSCGRTPVYIAAENGHAEVITALKAAGANVNIPAKYYNKEKGSNWPYKGRYFGYSPVQNTDQMTELKHACDLGTPVYIAVQKGHAAAITALYAAGANMNTTQHGQTLVYVAAENGHAATITALHAAGAAVDTPSEYHGTNGATPVYVAAEKGHSAAITALHAAGANINMPKNDITPICIAVQKALSHFHAAGKDNQWPQHTDIAYRYFRTITVLLESGADASVRTSLGTVLEIAKRVENPEHSEIVRLLEAHFAQYPNGIKPVSVMSQDVNFHINLDTHEQKNPPTMLTQYQATTPILKATSNQSNTTGLGIEKLYVEHKNVR